MTDEQPPAEPQQPATVVEEDFVVVLSADYVLRLERRLAGLERAQLQAAGDDDPGAAARLDRHRRDIDELKTRFNELIEYLERTTPMGGTL